MPYRVVFSIPDPGIYEGVDPDPAATFETFHEARLATVKFLETVLNEVQDYLDAFRAAKRIEDLECYDDGSLP